MGDMHTVHYKHAGDTIDYRPTFDVEAGDIITVGGLVGIARRDIPANTLGALAAEGVFEFMVAPSLTINFGDRVYCSPGAPATAEVYGIAAPGSKLIGVAVGDSFARPDGTSGILVRLGNPTQDV